MIFNKTLPRLILTFFLLSPLPLGVLAWFYIGSFEKTLKETVLTNLSSISDKKTDQINYHFDDLVNKIQFLAKLDNTINTLKIMSNLHYQQKKTNINSSLYLQVEKKSHTFFKSIIDQLGYYDLLLIDVSGNVVFSILKESDLGSNLNDGPYRDSALAHAYREAMNLFDSQLRLTPAYAPSNNIPAIFLVTPVYNFGKVIGTLALQINLEKFTRIVTDNTGLGQTGETLVGLQRANSVLYIGPMRGIKDAAFHYSLPWERVPFGMQAAVQGRNDKGITFDFGGTQVIGAWRYIPALGVGMVVKMNTSEAFAAIQRLQINLAWTFILLSLLASGLAIFLTRGLVGPIQYLTSVTRKIAEGDLSWRVPIKGWAELKILTSSFNHMARQIHNQTDILEQRVIERTEQYDDLTDRIPIGVYRYRILTKAKSALPAKLTDGEFEYISTQFCRIFQMSEKVIRANPLAVYYLVEPEDRNSLVEQNNQAMSFLKPLVWEGRFIIGGEKKWLRIESVPTVLPNGDSLWNGLVADITERKTVEATILDSAQQTHLILENILDGIVVIDEKGIIQSFNRAAERIFGYMADEVIGQNVSMFMQEPHRSLHDSYIANYRATNISKVLGKARNLEAIRKDGSIFSIDLLVSEVKRGDESLFVGIVRDITERKIFEAELVKAKEKAENANRAKGDFLANISHEIRTPMNAILGLTQHVLEMELQSVQKCYLKKVIYSSKALLGILNDVLDYAKIEAGKLDLEHIDFKLDKILEGVADLFAARVEEKKLNFSWEIAANVPNEVVGDPLRLTQILNNLVGNAIKFTEHGKVQVKVSLNAIKDDLLVLLFSVNDTGIGLSQQQIEKLFQAFSQADSSITRKYGGTGLGLAICNRLVSLMGGRISVTSVEGEGSSFFFTVNLERARIVNFIDEKLKTIVASVKLPTEEQKTIAGARVLLVEDNELNQLVALQHLKKNKFVVTLANNGREAVELVQAQDFDVILMDLHMPIMDGFEATSRIRDIQKSMTRQTPIIAMTAAVMPHDRDRCTELGMFDFIGKPIDSEELNRVLYRCLHSMIPPSTQIEHSCLNKMSTTGRLPEGIPYIDLHGALDRLDQDSELLLNLFNMFMQKEAKTLSVLELFIDKQDYSQVAFILHSLKSSAGNIGAMELAAAAAQLEAEVKSGSKHLSLSAVKDIFEKTFSSLHKVIQ